MIGMSQMKKKTVTGLMIGLSVGLVIAGLLFWWFSATIKSYKNGTNPDFKKKYIQTVSVLTKNMIQGQKLEADDLTTREVHIATVPIGLKTPAVGSIAKFNIPVNMPLADYMFSEDVIEKDIRSYELNTVLMPSDLNESQYIDIRLMFPNGTDYIVMAHKKVNKIIGMTMWIDINEAELLTMNAAMVDSFLKDGSKLYATKYIDGAAQISAEDAKTKTTGYISEKIKPDLEKLKTATADEATAIMIELVQRYQGFASTLRDMDENYQPNNEVIAMMKTNKNIIAEATTKLSSEARAVMENSVKNYEASAGDKYNSIVSGAKQTITTQKEQRKEILNP
ncbi:MAG: SAF domain-containing protein [Clostridia bacterium]